MGMLAELFDFAQSGEEQALAWIDEVRLSRMLEVAGVNGAASYVALDGAPRFLNLVEAHNVHVFYGEEFASLMESPEMGFPVAPEVCIRLVSGAGLSRPARPAARYPLGGGGGPRPRRPGSAGSTCPRRGSTISTAGIRRIAAPFAGRCRA